MATNNKGGQGVITNEGNRPSLGVAFWVQVALMAIMVPVWAFAIVLIYQVPVVIVVVLVAWTAGLSSTLMLLLLRPRL